MCSSTALFASTWPLIQHIRVFFGHNSLTSAFVPRRTIILAQIHDVKQELQNCLHPQMPNEQNKLGARAASLRSQTNPIVRSISPALRGGGGTVPLRRVGQNVVVVPANRVNKSRKGRGRRSKNAHAHSAQVILILGPNLVVVRHDSRRRRLKLLLLPLLQPTLLLMIRLRVVRSYRHRLAVRPCAWDAAVSGAR